MSPNQPLRQDDWEAYRNSPTATSYEAYNSYAPPTSIESNYYNSPPGGGYPTLNPQPYTLNP